MDYPTWLGLAQKDEAPRWGVLYRRGITDPFEFLFALDEHSGLPLHKITGIFSTQNPGVEFSLCDGRKGMKRKESESKGKQDRRGQIDRSKLMGTYNALREW